MMKEEKEKQASLDASNKRIAAAAKAIRDCTDPEALKAIEKGGKGNLLPD